MTYRDQRGSAVLEVLILGLVLLVPLIWLLGVLAEMHRAALATNAAAREVGWELTRAVAGSEADLDPIVVTAFADHGLDPLGARVTWQGSVGRGGVVEVRARYPVRVASFPLLGTLSQPVIWLSAVQRARIPSHRSDG